jgi:DNA-binding response OmpR family regulator
VRDGRPVVLLVDDEAGILSALRRTLRREGYQLLTAASAAEALETLAREPVDLVVSDQKMPGMSGTRLMAEVASRRPGVARLVLTGWPEEIPREERLHLGIRALIPKPWDDAELKATLRAHLPRAAGSSQAR